MDRVARWTKDISFDEVCAVLHADGGAPSDDELQVGSLVSRREPDWHYPDTHDGGADPCDGSGPRLGVVTGLRTMDGQCAGEDPGADGKDGLCRVKWAATGYVNSYEMGFGGKFCLQVVSMSAEAVAAREAAHLAERQRLAAAAALSAERARAETTAAEERWQLKKKLEEVRRRRKAEEVAAKREASKPTNYMNVGSGEQRAAAVTAAAVAAAAASPDEKNAPRKKPPADAAWREGRGTRANQVAATGRRESAAPLRSASPSSSALFLLVVLAITALAAYRRRGEAVVLLADYRNRPGPLLLIAVALASGLWFMWSKRPGKFGGAGRSLGGSRVAGSGKSKLV